MRSLAAILCALFVALAAGSGAAQPVDPHGAPEIDPRAEVGRGLLARHGCAGCHSLDGSKGPGPTFADRWGGLAAVRVGGEGPTTPVAYDRGYLARALAAPDAEVADGWSKGLMPAYDLDAESVDAIAAALAEAAGQAPDPPPRGWQGLVIGALIFVLGHFLLSAGPLRRPLAKRLGEAGFQIAYSVVAGLGLYLMVVGWQAAPYVELWPKAPWTAKAPLYAMPLAMLLWVFGFSTPNPTAAGRARVAEDAEPVHGIVAITRHPALWGFTLWGLAHMPPNGDLASVAFFGAFVVLALGGMWHIDRRRAQRLGPAWDRFAAQTSVVPFAALLAGRAKLRFGKGDVIRLVIAAVIFVGLLHTHHLIFGVAALY